MYDEIKGLSECAYDFIVNKCNADLECGRYDLDDGCYVNVEEYQTFDRTERKYENHRKYIDVQMVLVGKEIIEIAPVTELSVIEDYEDERDAAFYSNAIDGKCNEIKAGEYIVIWPNQGHMPCLKAANASEYVKKAVLKIPVDKAKKLFVMDVDGTLTDGTINFSENGELFKSFNVKDGYAIARMLPGMGFVPVIITGRESDIVSKRCKELKIEELFQGCNDKLSVLYDVASKYGIYPDEQGILPRTAYMGDDIPDLECVEHVNLSACPADSVDEVKDKVKYVCKLDGGKGAVREYVEVLKEHESI